MKAYISGPITHNPGYRQEFEYAKQQLEAEGYIVLNPATLPGGMTNLDYMRITLPMLLSADVVFFLPGWTASEGANIERMLSMYCGIEIQREAYSYKRLHRQDQDVVPLDALELGAIIDAEQL